MAEGKGISLAILGIVAVIAVVGLILLFTGAAGKAVVPGMSKVYPTKVITGEAKPGFLSQGEGWYNSEQKGECLSNEFFTQNPYGGYSWWETACRPGVRVTDVNRNRKFYGAENFIDTVEGWCCLKPNDRVPTGEEYPSYR